MNDSLRNAQRAEDITIKFDLLGRDVEELEDEIETLKLADLELPDYEDCDILKITYKLKINYLDTCADMLKALNKLCAKQPDLIDDVKIKELKHGYILMYEALKELDKLGAHFS